jgi:hypothetical protein
MTVKMLLLEYLQEGMSRGFYMQFLSHTEYNENDVLFTKRLPSASHRLHSTRAIPYRVRIRGSRRDARAFQFRL